MKTFVLYISIAFVAAVATLGLSAAPVSAVSDPLNAACQKDPSSIICTSRTQKLFGAGSIWTNIINTFIYIVGAVAIIMVVVGGLRYSLSGGDSSQLKSAKDTILYAIIGIVVSIAAYAIVNFVLSKL